MVSRVKTKENSAMVSVVASHRKYVLCWFFAVIFLHKQQYGFSRKIVEVIHKKKLKGIPCSNILL